MLVIDLTGPESQGKTIDEMLDFHSIDISRAIINTICDAVDKGASRACAVEIIIPEWKYSLTASYSNYVSSLEKNIPLMILTEEYEICAKAKKYIDKLNSRKINQKLLVDSNK